MYKAENENCFLSEIQFKNGDRNCSFGDNMKVDCFILHPGNISISVVYLANISNFSTVKLIEDRIQCATASSVNEIQSYILNVLNLKSNIFHLLRRTRNIYLTHRALFNGDVIILIEGLKYALVAPGLLEKSLHRIPDSIGVLNHRFAKILNYIALFISVFISSIYVAALSIREQLLLPELFMHILNTGGPFILPISLGVLILEVIVELIREAIWMSPPKNSFAIVTLSAIAACQMLTRNALFSPISVIVVITPFLLTFLIPDYLTIHSLRIMKLLMVIATGLFGILGFVLFSVVITVNIIALKYYGVPYSPFGWYELMRVLLHKVRTCLSSFL